MAESINWGTDLDSAVAEAKGGDKLVLLDFSAAPAQAFDERYQESSWAKKASVWKQKEAS